MLFNSASAYASSVINKFLNFFTVCGFRLQIFCRFYLHLRIPLTFCGTYLQLRNPEQLSIFACCGIRNKLICRQTYVTSISCKWNPLTFWNMFKYLSLKSRKKQTQNCAPFQCTVWPRNGWQSFWKDMPPMRFWQTLKHSEQKPAFLTSCSLKVA